LGLIAAIASAGSARAAGGVADDAQGCERQACLGGIGGCNMAFHIDRGGAGLRAQRGFSGPGRHHLLDTGKAAPDHPAAPQRHTGDPFFIERETRQPAGVAGQNLGRHYDIARFQRRIEATGDAEADDAPNRRGVEHRQQRPQLLRIATAADNRHAGAGRDAGLLDQTSHNQYRPRVNCIDRDHVVPRPQIHIPTPTTLLLVFPRFRYRASAQSGKNFA
jgi:hypothetical protein